MKRIFGLTMMMVLASFGWAQNDTLDRFSIGLNLMTHGEACLGGLPRRTNENLPQDTQSYFLLGRFRLNIDYEHGGLQTHAIIQNKSVWGSDGNTALKLYEGWAKLTARCGLFAQLGRVALAYDDERIIGPDDFAMVALSHDVAIVGYEGHGHRIHGIFAYNQNAEEVYTGTYYENGSIDYKTMQTLWYHYDIPKVPLGASLLFMNVGIQAGVENDQLNPPHQAYQQMWGGYLNFNPKRWTVEAAFYKQTGLVVNNSKETKPIDAWMASGKASFKPTDHYGFVAGYDYLSGDDYVPVIYGGTAGMPYKSIEGGFKPLFGSHNKFYGMMDYFYESAYTNGFTPGLQNAFIGVFGNPTSKLSGSLTYHYLAVATQLKGLNSTLGHDIDLQATYIFSKNVSLTAGFTIMRGTETMARLKQLNSSEYAFWGWFSLVVSPNLFQTQW